MKFFMILAATLTCGVSSLRRSLLGMTLLESPIFQGTMACFFEIRYSSGQLTRSASIKIVEALITSMSRTLSAIVRCCRLAL